MALALRPFQDEDVDWFYQHKRSLILYEPRLGKTVVSSAVMTRDVPRYGLITCPKNALFVWKEHLTKWFQQEHPDVELRIHIVRGTKGERELLWGSGRNQPYAKRVDFFICTYAVLFHDFEFLNAGKFHYQAVIGDEYHRMIKRHTGKIYKQLQVIAKDANRIHLLSGTPISRGRQDYFGALHLMDPKYFSSYWGFVQAYCVVEKGPWGGNVICGPRNSEQFKLTLLRFARVRLRADVGGQMPKVVRELLPCEMSNPQRHAYEQMAKDDFIETEDGGLVVAATSMENMLRRRQLLCCPAILDPALGEGGAMQDLIERLHDADTDEEKHCVIFTPFVQAIPHFRKALEEAGFNVFELKGGIEPEELERNREGFARTKGVLICSIGYAQAFSLETAHICYFIGYSWDPNDNKQAEDRLVAQIGEYNIQAWYYSYYSTTDEALAERVTIKQEAINFSYIQHGRR